MTFTIHRFYIEVLTMPEPAQPYHQTIARSRGFQLRKGQWRRCTEEGSISFSRVWEIPEPGGEVAVENPEAVQGCS